jgi:hypothetical protein
MLHKTESLKTSLLKAERDERIIKMEPTGNK